MAFFATVSYFVYELLNEPTKPYTGRSEPHWLNAIQALIVFGLPGLYVAVRGEYPKWGKGAEVFRHGTPSSADETVHPDGTGRK
jgi:hypothetical protein